MTDNKTEIANRLKEVRTETGLLSKNFAAKAGVDPRNYSSIEGGKRSIGDRVMNDICKTFNISTVWLKTGGGEKYITNSSSSNTQGNKTRTKGVIKYWTGVDATGSDAALFEDTLADKVIDISIPEFRDCTDAVNLYGDSMSPRYKSGQIIILKEWRESFIEFGNVFLLITKSGHRTVKRLKKASTPDEVLCVSENPEYDTFTVKRADILKLYIVKGAIEKTTL